ncbi:MAG TPA: metallophosphoesterase family protein [Candidatus Thermoplasmatota archaeon]|nr:metallophosphoesterase family protein [Candidatus Thermoplasmatota archaeon]
MRLPYVLAFLVLAAPLASAQASPELSKPEQIHVTLGAEPGTFVVHWAVVGTAYPSTASPVIEWTPEGGAKTVTPAKHFGEIKAAGSSPVDQAMPLSSHVYGETIGPIAPGVKVSYRVGTTQFGFSPQKEIRMVPGPGEPIKFVTYGDIGVDATGPDGGKDPTETEHPAFDIRELAIKEQPDLVVIPGDLAYSNSRAGWDAFMRFMEPVQASIPTMPVAGNHEYDKNVGWHQFLTQYVLPGDEHHYTFKAGDVTFIGVNSNFVCEGGTSRTTTGSPPRPCGDDLDVKPNATLLLWLDEALAAAAKDDTKWTVVYHHHPAFSHGRHSSDYAIQSLWAPLYEKHKVDLVITAHDHLYGRTYPVTKLKPAMLGDEYPKGLAPVYVVAGGGGRKLYDYPGPDGAPGWHAKGAQVHHLSVIEVSAEKLTLRTLDRTGAEIDAFTIKATEVSLPKATPGVEILALAAVALAAALGLRRR